MRANELLGKRMVWAEGVFLSQQHFQLWDALLRQQQHSYVEAVQTFNWGVLDLKWNLDNLGNGTLILQSCCCIFQNGLLVRVTDNDSPLEIKLSPKEAVQNIYRCYES